MRLVFAVLLAALSMILPAFGQDEQPWQPVVSGQIEALRSGDGAAALSFAGEGFRTNFEGRAEAFVAAVLATGYEPIVLSRSHTFGPFRQVTDTQVVQVVRLVGPDRGLYEAVYQLSDEAGEGWRIQGVALRRESGMGI